MEFTESQLPAFEPGAGEAQDGAGLAGLGYVRKGTRLEAEASDRARYVRDVLADMMQADIRQPGIRQAGISRNDGKG